VSVIVLNLTVICSSTIFVIFCVALHVCRMTGDNCVLVTGMTMSVTMSVTMSLTMPAISKHYQHQTAFSHSGRIDDSIATKTVSNSLRDIAAVLPFHESRYKDGGAHWYRSSAVMLHYHRLVASVLHLKENLIKTEL